MRSESLFTERYCDQRFFRYVYPYLFRGDVLGLREALERRFPGDELIAYLAHPDKATVKVALTCLGLVGRMCHCPPVARLLADEDPHVVRFAEHALVSIWHRAGIGAQNSLLREAVTLREQGQHDRALLLLHRLVLENARFAEAFHQRAVVHYLRGAYREAMADARRTLRLNPTHFASCELIGHGHTVLGEYDAAIERYYAALKIHPQLEGVQEALRQINDYRTARAWSPAGLSRRLQ
jgi:tetratricopeptide (TPR) repeat protein